MRHRFGTHALLATLLVVGARPAHSQTVRFGVMGDSVTTRLRAAWTDDSTQNERAYCVKRARISSQPVLGGGVDSIYRVLAVEPVATTGQDPNHVQFECAAGTPELHTHTPTTCFTDDPRSCHPDGPLAYSCQPSREDYRELLARGDQFGVIQCDRRAFRFYYPSDYHEGTRTNRAANSSP